MNREEKNKKVKQAISILITILALIMIGYGGWNVYSILKEEKEEKDSATQKMDTFRDSLGTVDYNPMEIEGNPEFNPEDVNTIGIMTIEELDVEAPITWMPAGDYAGQEAVLSAYIGQDELTPPLGMGKGNNSVFYSHSSIYSCAHCYFNNIDKLQVGDIVKILYYDSNEYMYLVTDVIPYLDPQADDYPNYLKDDPNKEKITLVTCTGGHSEYRTVVYADRLN